LPETKQHGLRDVDSLLEVAKHGGVSLWLHGHRHTPYYLQQPAGATFPVICAGSATQRHLWSYGEYTIKGVHLQALRRTYDPVAKRFRDAETFSLKLQ
jgi:predicted phosphodiesterase